jgi:hypothetical protein
LHGPSDNGVGTGPSPQTPAAIHWAPVESDTRPSDETLVRTAIERLRLTYNARLVTHRDGLPGGPLTFSTCDVTVAGAHAVATCSAANQTGDGGASGTLTFTLRRDGEAWAIRSMSE